jgi:hypothetical protein
MSDIVHLHAHDFVLGQQEQPQRQRKPSLKRQIKAVEKAGKHVTSVTTADGTTLHFGPDGSVASNEWDEVCRVKN